MEPTTDRQRGPKSGRTFRSHANERLRILGEIPVRKFPPATDSSHRPGENGQGGQPIDPDGNPDTSFLARIPADVAFTFQTLDRDGMVLNMAQTWHQLRPGEIRTDCGGCHAHSQKPTLFQDTAAAKPDYQIFDLTDSTPLVTTRANDQSGKQWDSNGRTGLRYRQERQERRVSSATSSRSSTAAASPATPRRATSRPANLSWTTTRSVNLPNADDVPGTYYRLAMDYAGRFGGQPLIGSWRNTNASRYVRMFQSRRSLLIWKIFGRRTDGWTNDDFPTETSPGDAGDARARGSRSRTPRPTAIGPTWISPAASCRRPRRRGEYQRADGKRIKVAGLSDEDRLTLVRWIDLGCPIDLDYRPDRPEARGFGWMLDDQRPTLTLTSPRRGQPAAAPASWSACTTMAGLCLIAFGSSRVSRSTAWRGGEPGESVPLALPGVWQLKLERPMSLASGKLTVSVQDRQGNEARIERTFSANGHVAASDPSDRREGNRVPTQRRHWALPKRAPLTL